MCLTVTGTARPSGEQSSDWLEPWSLLPDPTLQMRVARAKAHSEGLISWVKQEFR